MPIIQLKTSLPIPPSITLEPLLKTLSSTLSTHLKKSEAYIMTTFEPDVAMTFAGSTDPTCYVEIKSVGTMSPLQTQSMSSDICKIIEDQLGIEKNRTYIEFFDAKGAMWGWNGTTFG